MDFIPYKSNETLEHKYYQIPQELFVNEKYKNKLNSDSKILYAFLLDRLSLSQKNHWIDEDNVSGQQKDVLKPSKIKSIIDTD